MLIRLVNGVWLDPKAVTAIGKDKENPNGIVVHLTGGPMHFATTDDQQLVVDQIANALNKTMT